MSGVDAAKANGLQPLEKDLCPIEEFNFSKAAIQFSGKLVKDQAFTGWRILIRQISDVIKQGRCVNLEFSFGKFLANDREVHFFFEHELYLSHGLEVPDAPFDGLFQKASATFAAADCSVLRSLNLKGTGVRERRPTAGLTKKINPDDQGPPGGLFSSRAIAPVHEQQQEQQPMATDGWAYTPAEGTEGADVLTLMRTRTGASCGGGHSDVDSYVSRRNGSSHAKLGGASEVPASQQSQRAGAYESALHAYITDLELQASKKMEQRAAMDNVVQQHLDEDAEAQASKKARAVEHASFLEQQILAKRSREQAADPRGHVHEPPSPRAVPLTAALAESPPDTPWLQQGQTQDVEAAANKKLRAREHASFLQQQIQAKRSREGPAGYGQGLEIVQANMEVGSELGVPASGGSSVPRPPNSFRAVLDEQVQAKKLRQQKLRAREEAIDARRVEADNQELLAFEQYHVDAKHGGRQALEAAWGEDRKLKDMFKAIESNRRVKDMCKRGPSSGSRSSRGSRGGVGTPKSSLPPGSARGLGTGYGADSIGAAASLALQLRPLAAVVA